MEATTLPTEPLRKWVEKRSIECGSLESLARALGVDEAQLRRITRQRGVSLRVADRLLIAAGEPHTFATIYPLAGEVSR